MGDPPAPGRPARLVRPPPGSSAAAAPRDGAPAPEGVADLAGSGEHHTVPCAAADSPTHGSESLPPPSMDGDTVPAASADGSVAEAAGEAAEAEAAENGDVRGPPPAVLIVKSKGYGRECTGRYDLVQDELVNDQPYWHRPPNLAADAPPSADEIDCWLFSTREGEWKVTDDQEDFVTGAGFFNTAEHDGLWPHECMEWLGEDDEPDSDITVKLDKKDELQEGDRMIGGKRVLARVAGELTEEELLYAAFQRRRKYKKRKEIPKEHKCANCLKFDAVCAKCFQAYGRAQRERRARLKASFAGFEQKKRVAIFFGACADGREEEVRVMLNCGADVDWFARYVPSKSHTSALPAEGCVMSALHVACGLHQPDVCYVLLSKGCRYRKDMNHNWPLDYVTDEDAMHDIRMMLMEMNKEYETALQVQNAWDMYNDHRYEEAKEDFFELQTRFPNRDSCLLGSLYTDLALGNLEICVQACKAALRSDVRWVECSERHVKTVMENASKQHHDICHDEETVGSLKRCGCVLLPEDWTVPLSMFRFQRSFKFLSRCFSYLDVASLFATWIALYPMPLFRKEIALHAKAASRADASLSTKLVGARPAWTASLKEAIVEYYFSCWRPADGELACVNITALTCQCIPDFMKFEMHVKVVLHFSPPSTVSKIKTLFGFSGDKKGASRTSSPVSSPLSRETPQARNTSGPGRVAPVTPNRSASASPRRQSTLVSSASPAHRTGRFCVQMSDVPESCELGAEFSETPGGLHMSFPRPGTALAVAGALPGVVVSCGDGPTQPPTSAGAVMSCVAAARASGCTELILEVMVDPLRGAVVEVQGDRRTELNGERGSVGGYRQSPRGALRLEVAFRHPIGDALVRPGNVTLVQGPPEVLARIAPGDDPLNVSVSPSACSLAEGAGGPTSPVRSPTRRYQSGDAGLSPSTPKGPPGGQLGRLPPSASDASLFSKSPTHATQPHTPQTAATEEVLNTTRPMDGGHVDPRAGAGEEEGEEYEEGAEECDEELEEYEEEEVGEEEEEEEYYDWFTHPPEATPPGPSRNEVYKKFKRAGTKLASRADMRVLLCCPGFAPEDGPWPVLRSGWPQWHLELRRVPTTPARGR